MAKTETKDKIIEIGAELIRKKGFNNTGIQEILNLAGVPKGSFYFYFKSKEDFGVELIKTYGNYFIAMMQKYFNEENLSGKEKLKNFFASRLNFMQEEDFSGGCPVGNLSQELGGINEVLRLELKKVFNTMTNLVARCISESVESGEIKSEKDPGELAAFVLNSWEGALMRVKVDKSPFALEQFEEITFNHLLN
ncbi:MAG: TetR family transcriptional regulator C-terminal domain-containing protein [Rhodothermaceae bacterium]